MKLKLIVIVFLLLSVFAFMYFFKGKGKIPGIGKDVPNPTVAFTPTPAPKQTTPIGSFIPQSSGEVKAGGEAKVAIVTNTEGKQIVSFDVIVQYNRELLTFKSATSAKGAFKLYPFNQGNVVTLTGVQSDLEGGGVEYASEPIVELVFTATKKGTAEVSVLKTNKRATSGMITTENEDILKDVGKTSITIQ